MLLHEFLKDNDVTCPSCGYSLRDLQHDRCPECDLELALGIRTSTPRDEVRAWKYFFTAIVILNLPVLASWMYLGSHFIWGRPGYATPFYWSQTMLFTASFAVAIFMRIRLGRLCEFSMATRGRTKMVATIILLVEALLSLSVLGDNATMFF